MSRLRSSHSSRSVVSLASWRLRRAWRLRATDCPAARPTPGGRPGLFSVVAARPFNWGARCSIMRPWGLNSGADGRW